MPLQHWKFTGLNKKSMAITEKEKIKQKKNTKKSKKDKKNKKEKR